MSKLFSEGFDRYATGSTTELAMKWTTASSSANGITATTAWNSGQAMFSTLDATTVFDTASNETTVFFSIRIGHVGGAVTTDTVTLRFLDSSSVQTTIVWKSDGTISCYTGDTTGTLIQTFTLMFQPGQGVWDSWQGKIVISNTAGSIELRKSGNPTDVINLSNVNTRGGSTNSYVNKLRLANNSSSNWYMDDFFVVNNDGIAPSGWLGDIRCIEQIPTSVSSTQFTSIGAAAVFGQTGTGNTQSITANTLIIGPSFTTNVAGVVNKVTVNFNAAFTGNAVCAIYAYDGNAGATLPGTLIGTTNAVSNPAAGTVDFTFSSPPSVVGNTKYACGFLTDTTCVLKGLGSTTSNISAPRTYASGFPSPAPTTNAQSYTISCDLSATITPNNIGAVQESDGDTNSIASSTVGQEDLYGLSSLSGTQVSIAGVEYFAQVKKSDAGSRTGGLQLSQGGTEITAASNASLNQTYAYLSQFRTTDTSGAPLTATTINNTLIGPKVIA